MHVNFLTECKKLHCKMLFFSVYAKGKIKLKYTLELLKISCTYCLCDLYGSRDFQMHSIRNFSVTFPTLA